MVLVGDSGVGKSCLLKRFASNDWDPKFISTIGVDFEIMTLNILDKQIRLQIVESLTFSLSLSPKEPQNRNERELNHTLPIPVGHCGAGTVP